MTHALLTSSRSYRIRYDELGTGLEQITVSNGWRLGFAIFFGLLTAILAIFAYPRGETSLATLLIWSTFCALATIAWFASRQRWFVIQGRPQNLLLFQDRPRPDTVREFIGALYDRQREFLASTRLAPDPRLSPTDQLLRAASLVERGFLSPAEFERLKQTILPHPGGVDASHDQTLN